MLNLILFGPPGSGKGTQAEYICQERQLLHIATGDLFREHIGKNSELGQLAQSYMDQGNLVPDDVTIAMVKDRLAQSENHKGVVFDGFPRTIPQTEALAELLASMDQKIMGVIYIKVSDGEIVSRLSGRLSCKECQTPFHKKYNSFQTCPYQKCEGEYLYQRVDDKAETIWARLNVYHQQTSPLINYYHNRNLLTEVPGEGDVTNIRDSVSAVIESLLTD
ncbi:MAG: adenylate kinase [Chloroflexota bacterium]